MLTRDVGRCRAAEEVGLHRARRARPVGAGAALAGTCGAADVDEGLGGVEPQQAGRAVRAVRLQEGHGAVDSHLVIEIILEDVEVHQAVRLPADGRRQVVCHRSLRDAVEVRRLREVDVDADARGAEGLRVLEGVELDRLRLDRLLRACGHLLPERLEHQPAAPVEHSHRRGGRAVGTFAQQLHPKRRVHEAHDNLARLRGTAQHRLLAAVRRPRRAHRVVLALDWRQHARRRQRIRRCEAPLDRASELEHGRVPRAVHVLVPLRRPRHRRVGAVQLARRDRAVLVNQHPHRAG
mmetsp:Transcript_12462/g.29329  ORF Transcript_12462/g.29329 Transcript_12462/m.29329 type:complete len:294 (+) Transcript_12462:73-954(+)